MARIVSGRTTGTGAGVNPTTNYIPVNNNGSFVDSNVFDNNSNTGDFEIYTADYNSIIFGLSIVKNNLTRQVAIGDVDGSFLQTYLGIDDRGQYITASSNLTSNTAGGASGKHLKININGVDYKIALLNP